MKQARFRIIALVGALAMLLTLVAGCGTTPASSPAQQPQQQAPPSSPSQPQDPSASQPQQQAQAPAAPTPPSDRVFLSISSGPQGSGFFVVAGLIAEQVERTFPNARVTNTVGAPIRNTLEVNAGNADMGTEFQWLSMNGAKGAAPFEAPMDNVVAISNLYPTYFQLFVRANSGIKSYADLKGKRVAVGQAGTSADLITQRLLALYGFTYDDIRASGGSISFSSYEDAKQMMADGQLDAFTISSSRPNPQAVELQINHDIRLVALDKHILDQYLGEFAGFGTGLIPANTYKNQPEDVVTLTVPSIMVVRKDLPEDLVYWITKAWWDNADKVGQSYEIIKDEMKPELAIKDVALPLHPGAERYFREIGVLK